MKFKFPTTTEPKPVLQPGSSRRLFCALLLLLGLAAVPLDAAVTANGVTLTGKLIWHSYTTYGWTGVQSWMANFDTGTTTEITPARVSAAMNYHFNQNGTEVVFMGTDNNNANDEWDIWLASVTSAGLSNVTKITPSDGSRDEDPKFSSDGTKIIFKHDLYNIVSVNRSDIVVNGVNQTPPQTTLLTSTTEIGMPYYLVGSDINFLYAWNGTPLSINSDFSGGVTTLYQNATACYYPIALNSTNFYFALSDSAGHDQVMKGCVSGATAISAAFNSASAECADPFPMDPNWVCYTSTRNGGTGSYDIWIGNFLTGTTLNLNRFIHNSNNTNSDLGPCFFGTITGASPHLGFIFSGTNLVLSWPTNMTSFNLESTVALSNPSWSEITSPPVVIGGSYVVTNTIQDEAQFYRLHQR